MEADSAEKDIIEKFPGSIARLLKKYKTMNSEMFVFSLENLESKGVPERVFVKHYNLATADNVLRQFEYQLIFNERCKCELVKAPEPFIVAPANRNLVMEYVEGKDLKHLLSTPEPIHADYLGEIIDLSAIALSEFHKMFIGKSADSFSTSIPLLGEFVETGTLYNSVAFSKCNLNMKVRPFLDFAASNLVIDKRKTRIFLVDFPEADCLLTPHIDLARFKFNLEVIKQHPQFRFLKKDWWSVDAVYSQFLDRYCAEMETKPNSYDSVFIDLFEAEYARKLQEIYEAHRPNLRFIEEEIYFRGLFNSLLRK